MRVDALILKRDELQESAEERGKRLVDERAKLLLLEDRLTLRQLLPEIETYVQDAKWVERAKQVSRRFPAIKRSLTEEVKRASEFVLNTNFQNRFLVECSALRAPSVKLDFPGRDAKPARKKTLSDRARLSDILSEGEQKVIALADFLAEVGLRGASAPVVFDDPVTSLDYKRMRYVVRRIAELSQERQVIVFTHNVWFTMELLAQFDGDKERKKACTYYSVEGSADTKGVIRPGNSPRIDSWGNKRTRLNTVLDSARAEKDETMRRVLVEKLYEDLRGACEIVAEASLLQGVVQSYRPNIRMDNLSKIKIETLSDSIASLIEVWERCNRITGAHKQPTETLNVLPTLEQFEKDWKAVQQVHQDAK